jgi:hypothetical protein
MDIPESWTLIATSNGRGYWEQVDGSLMSDFDARKLHAKGKILMAQKRLPDGKMGLVIKKANVDDVEKLRSMILSGMSEVQITHTTGWSHHRIMRIRERAVKDGRPVLSAEEITAASNAGLVE